MILKGAHERIVRPAGVVPHGDAASAGNRKARKRTDAQSVARRIGSIVATLTEKY